MSRSVAVRFTMEGAMKVSSLLGLAVVVPFATLRAAETGDFDGDGRLTLADLVQRLEEFPAAEGSLDRFMEYPEYARELGLGYQPMSAAGLTYYEVLRRSVPNPLPHWVRIFEEPAVKEALPLDERVSLSMEAAIAPGGASDEVEITIRLSTTTRLRALLIFLENEERVLRVPPYEILWSWDVIPLVPSVLLGDLRVEVPATAPLVTNGRYTIHRGLFDPDRVAEDRTFTEPGEYRITVPIRLPKGTSAGTYATRILATSQILLDDWTPVAPRIGPPSTVTVQRDVTAGWDEGIPPLEVDPDSKQVLGKIQFRLANHNGDAPADGEPVLMAAPGETVRVRVQMRTEVPLNTVDFRIEWRSDHLRCLEYGEKAAEVLFTNPEDDQLYPYHRIAGTFIGFHCEKGWVLPPNHKAMFLLDDKYGARQLEYFKPLGEWRDVTEVQLHVSGCAVAGEEIPITFLQYSAGNLNSHPGPSFRPYRNYVVADRTADWSYDVDYQEGFLRINSEPWRCPDDWIPDPGVRIALGIVSASPGQTVEVPILASSETPPDLLQLGIESDPPEAVVTSVWVPVKSRLTGTTGRMEVARAAYANSKECDESLTCAYGVPASLGLVGNIPPHTKLEDRFAAITIQPRAGEPPFNQEALPDYPGTALVEIGRLRVAIAPNFAGTEIHLKNATVPITHLFAVRNHETGGMRAGDLFPAKEFREGVIRIIGPGRDFLRGDANLDRAADVSDAIAVLGYLFLGGGVLACEDTADADDNGEIEITDAIFLLGALFLGNGVVPAPFPDCGPDPQLDGLDCKETNCE